MIIKDDRNNISSCHTDSGVRTDATDFPILPPMSSIRCNNTSARIRRITPIRLLTYASRLSLFDIRNDTSPNRIKGITYAATPKTFHKNPDIASPKNPAMPKLLIRRIMLTARVVQIRISSIRKLLPFPVDFRPAVFLFPVVLFVVFLVVFLFEDGFFAVVFVFFSSCFTFGRLCCHYNSPL